MRRSSMPSFLATSRTAAAAPTGLMPPALVISRMPRGRHSGSSADMNAGRSRAYPPEASRKRSFCRMAMVSSASASKQM